MNKFKTKLKTNKMNRQIKFRAWDDLNKKWFSNSPNAFSLIGGCVLFGEWGNFFVEFLFNKNGKDQSHLIIEQYTGLKDKNGKDSFVGDFAIETMLNGEKRYYKIFEVKGGFAINAHQDDFYKNNTIPFYESLADMQTSSWFESRAEIVGNIHENPELCKQS